ncbi:MAG TPA: hypothetical protein VFE47_20280 [Tepidisphaeraceae bacterium]|nr:hypothetical protein [Tepidisphaeraceae bacterium]
MPEFDRDEMLFGSKVVRVAAELSASVLADPERIFVRDLYREYLDDEKPRDVVKWLRPRLETAFKCVGERPRWIERTEAWPFLNGRPMTFIRQFDVPEFVMPDGKTAGATTLYVFCAGVDDPRGKGWWQMQYTAVAQEQDLARARL